MEEYILINTANRSPRVVKVHFLRTSYLAPGENGPIIPPFSVHRYQ